MTLENYKKDAKTGVVLNTDKNGETEYRMAVKKSQELADLKYKVNTLVEIVQRQEAEIRELRSIIEREWK